VRTFDEVAGFEPVCPTSGYASGQQKTKTSKCGIVSLAKFYSGVKKVKKARSRRTIDAKQKMRHNNLAAKHSVTFTRWHQRPYALAKNEFTYLLTRRAGACA